MSGSTMSDNDLLEEAIQRANAERASVAHTRYAKKADDYRKEAAWELKWTLRLTQRHDRDKEDKQREENKENKERLRKQRDAKDWLVECMATESALNGVKAYWEDHCVGCDQKTFRYIECPLRPWIKRTVAQESHIKVFVCACDNKFMCKELQQLGVPNFNTWRTIERECTVRNPWKARYDFIQNVGFE